MITLLLDPMGLALDLGATLELEGNEVITYVQDAEAMRVGEGILDKSPVSTFGRYVKHVDMVVACSPGLGGAIEPLRKKGFRAIGASPGTDRLCLDTEFMYDLVKTQRIKVPRCRSFRLIDIDGAVKYVKRYEPMEFRSGGLDYIAENKEDMLRFLQYVASGTPGVGDSFILQEAIKGYKAVAGGYFNGHRFIKPTFQAFLAEKDFIVGQFAGKSRLFNSTMSRLSAFLKSCGFCGYIEGRFLISDGVPYLCEMRTGFPIVSTLLQLELIREGMASFLHRLSEGEVSTIKTFSRWGAGVPIGTALRHTDGLPIELPEDLKHIHLGQLRRDGNEFLCTGVGPAVLAAGHAKEIPMAISRARDLSERVKLPAKDLVIPVPAMPGYKELREWGYLKC